MSCLALARSHQANPVLSHINFFELTRTASDWLVKPDEHFAVPLADDGAAIHFLRLRQNEVLSIARYIYNITDFDMRHYFLRLPETSP